MSFAGLRSTGGTSPAPTIRAVRQQSAGRGRPEVPSEGLRLNPLDDVRRTSEAEGDDCEGREFMDAMSRLLVETDVNEDSGLDKGESSGNESEDYDAHNPYGAGGGMGSAFRLEMDYGGAESWVGMAQQGHHRQMHHMVGGGGGRSMVEVGSDGEGCESDADDEADDCHEIESDDGEDDYIPDLLHERGEPDVADYISEEEEEEEREFDENGGYLSPDDDRDTLDDGMNDDCGHFLTAPLPSQHRTLSAFEEPWRSSPFYRHMAHSYGSRVLPVLPGEVLPLRMQRDMLGHRHHHPYGSGVEAGGYDDRTPDGGSDSEDAAVLRGKRRDRVYGALAEVGGGALGDVAGVGGAGLGGKGLAGMYGGARFDGKPPSEEVREILADRDFIQDLLSELPGVTPSDPRIQVVLGMLRGDAGAAGGMSKPAPAAAMAMSTIDPVGLLGGKAAANPAC